MASLTLKDIPKRLHEQLRDRAVKHRRSLSQEALACLEQAVTVERIDPEALLAKARRLRARLKSVSQQDLDDWTSYGRS